LADTEWKIARSTHTCCLCQAKFAIKQPYYSFLVNSNGPLERRDYCLTCFEQHRPEAFFSFWKTAVPEPQSGSKPKPVLDVESVLGFFRSLAGDGDPLRVRFRYVLALMLMRKKIFKLSGSERGEFGETLIFVERPSNEHHAVLQPTLEEAELESVSAELGRLLGITPAAPVEAASATPGVEAAAVDGAAGSVESAT